MIRILIYLLLFSFINFIFGDFDNLFFEKWLKRYREVSGNQNPPLRYKEWIKLTLKLGCSIDPADYKQIFADLKPFKNMKLTVAMVEEFSERIFEYGTYNIGKNKSVFLMTRFQLSFKKSLAYLPHVLDPSIDFFVITHNYDEGMVAPADDDNVRPYDDMPDLVKRCKAVQNANEGYLDNNMHFKAPCSFIAVPFNVPVFSTNRLKGFKDILLPSYKTGLLAYRTKLKVALEAPVWERKIKKAVFRGRTTGVNFQKVREQEISLTKNVRFKLHEMSMMQKRGQLKCQVPLDFGLTEIWQCDEDEYYIENLKNRFPLVLGLDYKTQFKHKYLVVVDGNGWPDRVAYFMLSGSLVFLATVHEEWVINQLVDGENYVKIKPDLSDLVEKLEWAAKNDKEAKRIATNGREFAMKKFGLKPMQAYNMLLFMEYQRLFK